VAASFSSKGFETSWNGFALKAMCLLLSADVLYDIFSMNLFIREDIAMGHHYEGEQKQ
jgi:hypothetical protein